MQYVERNFRKMCGNFPDVRYFSHATFRKKRISYLCAVLCRGTENEVNCMNRPATGVMTGLAVGLAAGTAVYAAANMTTARQRRKMKKAANRAMKNVEGIVSDMAYIVKP